MSAQLAQAVRDLLKAQVWQEYRPARDFEIMPTKELAALRKALDAFEAAPQQAQAPTQAEVDLNEALLEVDYWKRIAAHLAAPVGYKLVPIREVQQAQAPGWQAIETAPKDFVTEFDGWNGERVPNVSWARPEGAAKGEYDWCVSEYISNWGHQNTRVRGLTHWMPLPAAPQQGSNT